VRNHTRKMGEIAPWVRPKCAKTCFVLSVTNTKWPFSHLSCTDFDHFWNKRSELVSACVHRWKISEFLHRVFPCPKNIWNGYFEGGVFVIEVQLKRHNFRRWESFRRLVDIPRICLLYMSFAGDVWFGSCKPTKKLHFGDPSLPSIKWRRCKSAELFFVRQTVLSL